MPNDPPKREDHEGDLATQKKSRVEKVRRYKVVLHNDNYTTMEFVILVLMKFFHKTETEATHIMLSVHHKGSGVHDRHQRQKHPERGHVPGLLDLD